MVLIQESNRSEKINSFAQKRAKSYTASADPLIGCIELSEIIILDDEKRFMPEAWSILISLAQ
jgi:hypothetical protein